MMPHDLRTAICHALGSVAPEADLDHLHPDVHFRDQLDIDSMDFLNFVIALHKQLHVDIPEQDYPKLVTLSGCLEYLTSRCADQPQP